MTKRLDGRVTCAVRKNFMQSRFRLTSVSQERLMFTAQSERSIELPHFPLIKIIFSLRMRDSRVKEGNENLSNLENILFHGILVIDDQNRCIYCPFKY